MTRAGLACLALLAACGGLQAVPSPQSSPRTGDWPMLGGRPDRNAVSDEKGLPASWKLDAKKNVKWIADLGKVAYTTPVVAGGRVYMGTNVPRPPAAQVDSGVLMCLSAADGSLLWQSVHEKLPLAEGESENYEDTRQGSGVCSTPFVAGDRVYYVSNRGELVCADALGFSDGENDGPYKEEKSAGKQDADLVWSLDMRKQLGVTLCLASASAPLVVDGLLYVVTGQSADRHKVKNPSAPSFIAVDAATGNIAWQDSSPGDRIISAQWGSPAYAVVDGQPQVAFPGGDGWLYAFEPRTGKLLWKFNCKAHEKPGPDGKPETHNTLVATPVYHGYRILIGVGEDTERSGPPGCLRAIDARKRGDVTASAELWRTGEEEFGRTIASVVVHDGRVYAAEQDGYLHCLDLETGRRAWRHDTKTSTWGGLLVADGKVHLSLAEGRLLIYSTARMKALAGQLGGPLEVVFKDKAGKLIISKDKKVAREIGGDELGSYFREVEFPHALNFAPVVANGVVYVLVDNKLYAIAAGE